MYYGHLNSPSFIPRIGEVYKAGRGYKAKVINEQTGFNKEMSLTEINMMLNSIHYGYRISPKLYEYITTNNVESNITLNRIKFDYLRGICIVD